LREFSLSDKQKKSFFYHNFMNKPSFY
jgi:hypothetical protein